MSRLPKALRVSISSGHERRVCGRGVQPPRPFTPIGQNVIDLLTLLLSDACAITPTCGLCTTTTGGGRTFSGWRCFREGLNLAVPWWQHIYFDSLGVTCSCRRLYRTGPIDQGLSGGQRIARVGDMDAGQILLAMFKLPT